jgi:hypothetical protein
MISKEKINENKTKQETTHLSSVRTQHFLVVHHRTTIIENNHTNKKHTLEISSIRTQKGARHIK